MQTSSYIRDSELLRRYVDQASQEAFSVLVHRHLDSVYSTCVRELNDASLAEDTAQTVLLILARKARRLTGIRNLSGWLFLTARNVCRNTRNHELRRKRLEEAAIQEAKMLGEHTDLWAKIEPELNDAVSRLSPSDREALLLKFWHEFTFRQTGDALGISEDAARKRVSRAVERLRSILFRHGLAIQTPVFGTLLTEHALRAAPRALHTSIVAKSFGSSSLAAGMMGTLGHRLSQWGLRSVSVGAIKGLAIVFALFAVGAAFDLLVKGAGASPPGSMNDIDTPVQLEDNNLGTMYPPDSTRNAILTGRLVHADGSPAGGVAVAAQIQDTSIQKYEMPYTMHNRQDPPGMNEWDWNYAKTDSNGVYSIPVAPTIGYNVMAYDFSGNYVAGAIRGAHALKNAIAQLPRMTLTRGGLVEGTVYDKNGHPKPNADVGCYDAHRPDSGAAVDRVRTDENGRYRIRVSPGAFRVYWMDYGVSLDSIYVAYVAADKVKIINITAPKHPVSVPGQ